MRRKRACAVERRIERLKTLGRLADEALPPAAADKVMLLIGRAAAVRAALTAIARGSLDGCVKVKSKVVTTTV